MVSPICLLWVRADQSLVFEYFLSRLWYLISHALLCLLIAGVKVEYVCFT